MGATETAVSLGTDVDDDVVIRTFELTKVYPGMDRPAVDKLNLTRAIRKLPFGYKRIFFLYDIFGYPHSEIAELLGCSIGCSKSQLHKARKRLRQLLQGELRQRETVVPA